MSERKFSRVRVSPATAAKWLEEFNYEDNRPIRQRWVDYLARQMAKGMWQDNGEPLIFDVEGHMLDGQHRLSAVVKSGVTITFDVRRGVATEAFTTIDQAASRTPGVVLGMSGVTHSHTVAAVCRMIFNWEHSGSALQSDRVSPDEILAVLEEHKEPVETAAIVAVAVRNTIPMDGSLAGFCHWLFAKASRPKCDSFFETLRDGTGAERGNPALALRNRLFREAMGATRKRLPKKAALALVVRAWNYHHKGDPVTKLGLKPNAEGGFTVPPVRGLGRGQGGRCSKQGNGAGA